MTRKIVHTIVLLITIIGCTNKDIQKADSNLEEKKTSNHNKDTIASSQDYKIYVSDTVRKIIDKLNLCQYTENMNENVPDLFDCYDKYVSDIRLIKKGDYNYDNFIFQSPGGSGGGTIIIYSKINGKYEIVQDDYGYISEILKTTTKGYYDLIIWHRAQKAGGEEILYKWDGRKYQRSKELKTDYKN